jgi:hypothetical protein
LDEPTANRPEFLKHVLTELLPPDVARAPNVKNRRDFRIVVGEVFIQEVATAQNVNTDWDRLPIGIVGGSVAGSSPPLVNTDTFAPRTVD